MVRNSFLESLMRLPKETRDQFEKRAFDNAKGYIAMYRAQPDRFQRKGYVITEFLVETRRVTPSRYDLYAEITEESE